MDALSKAEFYKEDGSALFIKDLQLNEEQKILTVEMSDNTVFHLKIKQG
jgi:hypothetical protein